jgi:hypothetical protein
VERVRDREDFKLLPPHADSFLHQLFNIERHAVGLRLADELAFNINF